MNETWRFFKFVLFSASAGLIQVVSFVLFDEVLHWPYWLCYLLALVLSVLWNFTLNRTFTFRSAANVPRAMLLVALYLPEIRRVPPPDRHGREAGPGNGIGRPCRMKGPSPRGEGPFFAACRGDGSAYCGIWAP